MFTDTAHHQTDSQLQPAPRLLGRAAGQLRQFFCGLHGHDALLHFEHGRMSLLCTSCGYESPGWEVKAQPATRERVDSGRIVQLPLVRERRVA
jgi:hypothetical protein